jgi:hypothetical protein
MYSVHAHSNKPFVNVSSHYSVLRTLLRPLDDLAAMTYEKVLLHKGLDPLQLLT